MSTKRKLKVLRWAGRYLTGVSKGGVPAFSYAPTHAETFETEAAVRARISQAEKFPGDYEIIDDPVTHR